METLKQKGGITISSRVEDDLLDIINENPSILDRTPQSRVEELLVLLYNKINSSESSNNKITIEDLKSSDNVIISDDGTCTQTNTDTKAQLNFQIVGTPNVNDNTEVLSIYNKTVSSNGTISTTFAKTSDVNALRIGHNGSSSDSKMFIDISKLENNKTYIIKINILNYLQSVGHYSWNNIRIEEHTSDTGTEYTITWIADHYIDKTNGTVKPEEGSSCSDFVEIGSETKIEIINTMTTDTEYNVFYNSDKEFISSFSSATGIVDIPSNAKYFRLSRYTSATVVCKRK